MIKEIVASGKDVIEAKENARLALGAGPLDDVNFEIIHAGSKGIFGIIGVKPAQVRAYIEIPDENRGEKNRKKHDKPKKTGKERREARPERKPEAKQTESKEAKNAAPVIPETELKLERREVKAGEDMSFDFVTTLIKDIGLSAEAELYACEDGTRRIIIAGEDASTLIGHHGDTLDALQYLANLASAKKNVNGERDKSRVTIDIEGYRAKREETLRALARRMAAKALRNKRSVMLEPMSAYERRIIHSEVQGIEGVSTNSVGSDNNRKIVIYLTDKKPKGLFDEDTEVPEINDMNEAEGDYITPTDTVTDSFDGDDTVAIQPTIPDENDDIVDDGDNK
ncbi:MAG: Jag N-terminal domain-containing protein [Clostridia bacterium]|nr:Jag N-terminal domain-containing protein [Clostridia bacterium]